MSLRLCLVALALLSACRRREPAPPVPKLSAREQDRRDLLRAPKGDWTPGSEPRRLSLLLLTDRAKIRKGEAFRYRLEMRNMGREPLSFVEAAPTFVKDGSLCGEHGYSFLAIPPKGKERTLPCRPAPAAPGLTGLDLTLAPGEFLLTRGPGAAAGFRDLLTSFAFDAVGTYRLKAVYAPAGGPRAVSNTVALDVVP